MKRAIIIPTYKPHFKYIKNLIESFYSFSFNSLNIDLCFIVSNKSEEKELTETILSNFKFKNLKCINFEDILNFYNNTYSPEELLLILGRYTFQTIKKFYSIHYLKYDQTLILDSESMFSGKVNLNVLFDNYFNKPFVFYSNMPSNNKYKEWLDYKTSCNCSSILSYDFGNRWYLEGFHWFYDYKIIKDLFNEYNNDLINIFYNYCKDKEDFDKAIFECIFYYQYINKNNNKYHYSFIDSKEELEKILPDKSVQNIFEGMQKSNLEFLPFTIHSIEYAKFKDIKYFAKFYNTYKFPILRLGCAENSLKKLAVLEIVKKCNVKIICSTDRVDKYKNILKLKNYLLYFINKNEDIKR